MDLLPSLLSSLKAVGPGSVEQEYSVLRSRSLALKRDLSLSTEVGALKENIKKNRYKDILPYDQSRVVLTLLTSDVDSDYINASFIKGASADRCYIAAQAPLSSTVTDFWRMIWQYDVRVIVMACREVEMGKRKCETYWAAAHQAASFGAFTVTTQGETHPNQDVVVRTLTVTFQQDSRSVVQYQFLSWPDHDVPYETAGVLDLLERVRSSRGASSSPLLIHCSAGCGRTGVICALDYIHDLLVTKRLTADFSILSIVLDLRSQRPSAVQTKDQYQFIFTAVVDLLQRFLRPAGPQLYCNLSQLETPEKKKTRTTPAPPINRPSSVTKMNDTYAVVNKPKQSHPPPSNPAHSAVATPRSNNGSRTLPSSHHYDNDNKEVSATPIYSIVRPRVKPLSLPPSATPIYDIAAPTNHMPREEPDYQLVSAEQPSADDDDYEDFSSSDMTSFCSPGGIGFNCRVQKPRGPRDPPAEWSRLER